MTRPPRKTFAQIRADLPTRPAPSRVPKTTVLIVGEGRETEPNYFLEFRNNSQVRQRFTITVKRGNGGSPMQIVEEAVKEKQRADEREEPYDQCYCLMDIEGPGRIAMLEPACKLADENKVEIVFSNPSFECWLIAHFERTCRPFHDGSEVEEYLNRLWQKQFGQDYRKEDKSIYKKTAPFLAAAIPNAKLVREKDHGLDKSSIDANSSTDVYALIIKLQP